EGSPAPLLPGTATASEAMQIMERGYTYMKFFPAEQAGGAPYLKALSSPLADLRFCPTGGVSLANVKDYLSLPNVVCVGGSWVAPKQAIAEGNWTLIESLAAEAAAIRP
ncbi:MAG: keto-deoxy-phosphogluconate aldolase, partial [Rhizobiales bacterium]|nr:keto-deoxy-phosphogluconate aldolase [Hyphomicrobiales bacterium]